MSKRVLLVAFNFPPIKISSGLERTLAMVRHLPGNGWEPLVLSATASAYTATSDERLLQVPTNTIVRRTLAFDAGRDFAICGRYPGFFGLPDRWQTWILSAVPAGMAMIRKHRPDIIWSTYPIASAHIIAHLLHRLSGVPWVADFRDPMVEYDQRSDTWWPNWAALRNARLAIERSVAKRAVAVTFCTDGARTIFMDRYRNVGPETAQVIPNGFDESAFRLAEAKAAPQIRAKGEILLLHSGTIYSSPDRDPTHFFRALRRVLDSRDSLARPINILMRASGVDAFYAPLVEKLGLNGVVTFGPAIAYQDALCEMLAADGLLLFQGHTSNPAIPAKIYEYFRAGRPILAMVDEEGDTAKLLRREGIVDLCPLDDESLIASTFLNFIARIEGERPPPMSQARVQCFERSHGVMKFASLFDAITSTRSR